MSVPTMAWKNQARCAPGRIADPDVFFPHANSTGTIATRLCGGCRVTDDCLAFAMSDLTLEGIWGGLDRKQRLLLAKQRLLPRGGAWAVARA